MKSKPNLSSIYLVAFLDMLGFGIIIPIIRDLTIFLSEASHISHYGEVFLSGILMSSYSIFQFIFAPILGQLSDKYGRKPILAISIFGNVISYLLWVISSSFWIFLLSRIISGLTGGNISVAQSYAADISSEEDRGKVMGTLGALFGIGFILGPFIGGVLGKQSLLLIQNNTLGSYTHLINYNPYALVGLFAMLLSIINLFLVSYTLVEPKVLNRKITKLKNILNPLLLISNFKKKSIGRIFLIGFLLNAGFIHIEATLAWELLYRFNLDERSTGYFFAYMGILMVLVQGILYRRLYPKLKEAFLFKLGLCITGMFLLIITFNMNILVYSIMFLFIAIGLGFANPSLNTLISLKSPANEQGINMGLLHSFSALARAFIPFYATYIYQYVNPTIAGYSSAFFIILAFIISIKVQQSKKKL